jgi:hypothetical protein
MTLSEQDRADFVGGYTRAVINAWSNEEFAAKLESDPKVALAEAGIEIPAGATVQVDRSDPPPGKESESNIEQQVALFEQGQAGGSYVFLIPSTPQIETEELSEQDLAGVSGGDTSCCCCPCCCCT